MMRFLTLFAFLSFASCNGEPRPFLSDSYWSDDRSSGFFINNGIISIGTVVYERGAPVEFGVESKIPYRTARVQNGVCIMGDDLAIALPGKMVSGDITCGDIRFNVQPCKKDECDGVLVRRSLFEKGRQGPLFYSYIYPCGITSMSYDRRGIRYSTLHPDEDCS